MVICGALKPVAYSGRMEIQGCLPGLEVGTKFRAEIYEVT